MKRKNIIAKVAFDKAVLTVRQGKQAMIFVHSRKDTVKTAREMIELATEEGGGLLRLLSPLSGDEAEEKVSVAPGSAGAVKSEGRLSLSEAQWAAMQREIAKSRNAELQVNGYMSLIVTIISALYHWQKRFANCRTCFRKDLVFITLECSGVIAHSQSVCLQQVSLRYSCALRHLRGVLTFQPTL